MDARSTRVAERLKTPMLIAAALTLPTVAITESEPGGLLQQVAVGRDYGNEIEITGGLKAGATIVANPGDDVSEGALVMPRRQKPKDAGRGKLPPNGPPAGDESPSMTAPTKGRK